MPYPLPPPGAPMPPVLIEAVVPMVPAPPPPMAPLQSTTVRALLLVGASQIVLGLIPMLQAHSVDPWALGIIALPVVAGILVRIAAADVRMPFTKAKGD